VHEIDLVAPTAAQSPQRSAADVKAGSADQCPDRGAIDPPTLGAGAVGFEVVGAASISFVGTLAGPATWSMPSPAGATGTDSFFLARLQELAGQTRFVLIGIGTLANGRLVSDTALAGTAVTFEGVRTAGRYVFFRTTNAMAFAAGRVTVEGGAGFAGALITSSTAAIVSLSQVTGHYISAIALGNTSHRARSAEDRHGERCGDGVGAAAGGSARSRAGRAPADGHIRDTRRWRGQHCAGRSDRRPLLQSCRCGDGDAPDRSPHLERRRGRRHARDDGQ
jgi:hypothetical protein